MDQEKETHKTDTQDAILLAALKLFAEKGYFNTSLTDIAEAAGIKTAGAIYQHFKHNNPDSALMSDERF